MLSRRAGLSVTAGLSYCCRRRQEKNERKGKGRKGRYTKSQDVIFQLFVGCAPLGRFP